MRIIVWISLTLLLLSACEETYIPKPRGYYRIALPKKEYKNVDAANFKFDILKSSSISANKKDSSWITIDYKPLNASIYLSFFNDTNIDQLSEDARNSAYKHAIKADDIVNLPFAIPEKNIYGYIYSIEGNAASPVIFQINDNERRFVHGSLYFNCEPNADSLKPAVHFVRQDIQHIIETFEWKK
jgi:gliding motility-associated lipoprotein GldD